MIKRLSKNNDFKDFIVGCNQEVIKGVKVIKYYIDGKKDLMLDSEFKVIGDSIQVFLDREKLQTLSDGILCRRVECEFASSRFADDSYNFVLEDQLDIWLGDDSSSTPDTPAPTVNFKTINGQSIVGDGNIEIEGISPSDREKLNQLDNVTSGLSEVSEKANNAVSQASEANRLATQANTNVNSKQDKLVSGVNIKTINGESIVGEGNINIEGGSSPVDSYTRAETDNLLSSKADKSELPDMSNYATKSELNSKADAATLTPLTGRIGAVEQAVQNKADKTEIPSLTGYATETWVQNQGYLTEHQSLADYATKSELNSKADASALMPLAGRIGALEQEVQNKADKSEIPSLTGYATETWVQNQGYLTEHQDISGKVDKSSIWTGTEAEWNALTQEQKSSYTIALVR